MPVQSTQVIVTAAAFTLRPQTGDQPPSFDRCVITNQSGYQLRIEAGPSTLIVEPWTKDIVPTYGNPVDITPVESSLIIEGAPAYVAGLWLTPKDPFDTTALPATVATGPTVAGTSPGVQLGANKTFWSAGKVALAINNTDTVYNLDSHTGWGAAAVNGPSYTVPAGKQLVITNVNLSVRPGIIAYQVALRSAVTPLTTATLMYGLTIQTAGIVGAPPTYVAPGYAYATYFGESSLVLEAGKLFVISAFLGAASGFIDIFFAGFLQDVAV
jgi:hypothetical protein